MDLNNHPSDNSVINNEKNSYIHDKNLIEGSFRLNSIKEENMIEYNPHNYQSYFQNPQIVGKHHFIQDHNNMFKKNLNLSKNSKNKQEENDQSEELIKDKSNNSVIVIGFEKSMKENKEVPLDEFSKKEQTVKEDKKSEVDNLDKETNSKDVPIEKKAEQISEPVNNKKKILNNACCYIL